MTPTNNDFKNNSVGNMTPTSPVKDSHFLLLIRFPSRTNFAYSVCHRVNFARRTHT